MVTHLIPIWNWDADCFPELRNKPDGPYMGEEDWDKTKYQERDMDRNGKMRLKYMKAKIFGKYRTGIEWTGVQKTEDGEIFKTK